MTTKEAIKQLVKALTEDPGYYIGWKANIAVKFQDEYERCHGSQSIHEISNQAADNFLKLLCSETERGQGK